MEQKCDETFHLSDEYRRHDELCEILHGYGTVCFQPLEDLNQAIGQATNEVMHSELPVEQKRAMLYDFLVCTYRSIIGYNLTLDGAIVVTKEVLTGFENDKALDEHEKEMKFDRFVPESKID